MAAGHPSDSNRLSPKGAPPLGQGWQLEGGRGGEHQPPLPEGGDGQGGRLATRWACRRQPGGPGMGLGRLIDRRSAGGRKPCETRKRLAGCWDRPLHAAGAMGLPPLRAAVHLRKAPLLAQTRRVHHICEQSEVGDLQSAQSASLRRRAHLGRVGQMAQHGPTSEPSTEMSQQMGGWWGGRDAVAGLGSDIGLRPRMRRRWEPHGSRLRLGSLAW